MNSETANLSSAPASAGAVRARTMLLTLMRREFWEHTALWRVPAAVAALLAVLTLFSSHVGVEINGMNIRDFDGSERIMVLNMSQLAWAGLLYLTATIVVTFYSLDCLYTERKDRSILFWKSLPVSDAMTVLSKFLVAVVIVPLLAFALALASHLLAFLVWKLRAAAGGVPDVVSWNTVAWVRGEIVIFLILALGSLWYAPVVAAALLASAWLKRNPLVWVGLGLILAPFLEYIVFRTGYLASVIAYRANAIWHVLTHVDGHSVMTEHVRLLSDLNWSGAYTYPALWLGLAASAALLYGAARVRRYRDDT
jgi:ABC-2 type transport system permease protein